MHALIFRFFLSQNVVKIYPLFDLWRFIYGVKVGYSILSHALILCLVLIENVCKPVNGGLLVFFVLDFFVFQLYFQSRNVKAEIAHVKFNILQFGYFGLNVILTACNTVVNEPVRPYFVLCEVVYKYARYLRYTQLFSRHIAPMTAYNDIVAVDHYWLCKPLCKLDRPHKLFYLTWRVLFRVVFVRL